MMGKKKLREIREELHKGFAAAGTELVQWFDRQVEKLERQKLPDRRAIKTLTLIRDNLARPAQAIKRPRKKAAGR